MMREKRFNGVHRLIHWAIAFTVLFILMTVFLRQGWMNKDSIGTILQTNLSKLGTSISTKDAGMIGKEVRKPMWSWHVVAGYVLIGLYVIRMIITSVQGATYPNPFRKNVPARERFKSTVYLLFYMLVAASLFTGFMMVNGPKGLHDRFEVIHIRALYYMIPFIIIHLSGVLIADGGEERGIISKMVSGDKPSA